MPPPIAPPGSGSFSPISTPPSTGVSNAFPFSGQTILVIFNPKAKQGRFVPEAASLRNSLEQLGFQVVFMETAADPAERSARIREVATELFAEPNRGAITIFPVGGDGIIDEGVREVVQGLTGNLMEMPPNSTRGKAVQAHLRSVIVANVGSLSDLAYQLGAPPRLEMLNRFYRRVFSRPPPSYFSGVSEFISQSRTLPYSIPMVDSPVAQGRSIFHSVGWGTSGFLFEQGERIQRENPNRLWNQKPWVFFRLLPSAIRKYGLRGVGVTIEKEGVSRSFLVGDLLGAPNRIISAVGGIPGRWGEFQLMAIPNGPHGVLVMGESIFRGVSTLLGGNSVGADATLWTLPRERLITIRPGERVRLRFFDPRSHEPITVPWQLNGDAVPQSTHEAEIYVPPVTVPVGSAQKSLAVRLFERDERRRRLSEGEGPSMPQFRRLAPPSFLNFSGGGQRATSSFYPASDLRSLTLNLDLEPSRLPLLVARAHGTQSADQLSQFQSSPLSMAQIDAWTRSEEGRLQIEADRALMGDTFRNRLETHGVGLGFGLATMFASDRLMSYLGVDPQRDPVLHFTGVALSSHAMNQVGNAWAGVFINRARGIPYDWAMAESRGAGGLLTSRMVYESNPSLLRSLGVSTLRGLGIEGGTGSILLRGARNLIGVPYRMVLGMGSGLACSRITDTILSRYTSLDESSRRYAAMGAFFIPQLYHLAVGNRGLGFLESTTLRRINGVFAAGFAADLGFMGWQSLEYGNQSSYERWVNHRASALREAEEGDSGLFSLGGIFQMISPEISSWWDTVEGWDFHRNQYYQRIIDADRARIRERFGNPSSH
jgi:hypothetical protein